MNRAMLKFKHDLLSWRARILRAGYLKELSVEDLPNSEFRITGSWEGGSYTQTFSQEYVLGRFMRLPPIQQTPCRRVCAFRDDFVRSVLHARGV